MFRLHKNAAAVKHIVNVARAVPDGKNHFVVNFRAAVYANGRDFSVFNSYVGKLCVKPNLSAKPNNFVAQVFDDGWKFVASDMRLKVVFYLFGRAETQKIIKNRFNEFIVYLRVKFPVRKRTRAALAELHVALFVQNPRFNKPVNRFFSLVNVFAPLYKGHVKAPTA